MSVITTEAKRDRTRLLKSVAVLVLYLVLGIAYLFPDELVRDPNALKLQSRSSVIVYIEQFTSVPIWGTAFLIGALALLAGLLKWRKFLPSAHLICASVMVGYAVSGFTTAYINPGTYIVSAAMSTFIVTINLLLMFSYTSGPMYVPLIDGVPNDEGDDEDAESVE